MSPGARPGLIAQSPPAATPFATGVGATTGAAWATPPSAATTSPSGWWCTPWRLCGLQFTVAISPKAQTHSTSTALSH